MSGIKRVILSKFNTQYTGQRYLIFWSKIGSPTPPKTILFILDVNKKSVIEDDDSLWCVGSLMSLCKLKCWHESSMVVRTSCIEFGGLWNVPKRIFVMCGNLNQRHSILGSSISCLRREWNLKFYSLKSMKLTQRILGTNQQNKVISLKLS